MTENPGCCLFCGSTPVDETKEDHPPLPAVHAAGFDVNWGDEVYICWTCAGIIADLLDRPSRKKVQAVYDGMKLQKKENGKVVKRNEKLQSQVDRLLAGRKAEREVRRERRG